MERIQPIQTTTQNNCLERGELDEDTVKRVGFRIVAAVATVAEHSMARQYSSGRPDTQDEQDLLALAKQKISVGTYLESIIPGNRPYKPVGNFGMVPMPGENYIACGVCATECPGKAIDPHDSQMVDDNKCISCMRCMAVCTQGGGVAT